MEITVSYSELADYRQCPLKHRWAWKERWRPETPAPALAFGIKFHEMMEAHYRALQQTRVTREAVGAAVGTALGNMDATDEDLDLLELMYRRYVEEYGLDEQWEILDVERNGRVLLGTLHDVSSTAESVDVYLKYKIDLIARHKTNRLIYVIDHKTCKTLTPAKMLDLDDQTALYEWAFRKETGKRTDGSMHNEIRKVGRTGNAPVNNRTAVARSDRALAHIARDALGTVYNMLSGLPVSSPNMDTCKWKCPYVDAHLMVREGIPEETALRDFGFHVDERRH